MQERFAQSFGNLREWKQIQFLASRQRIAAMMDAEGIAASPVLSSGSLRASAEAVDEVLELGDDVPTARTANKRRSK